jgi:hypothetical protein
LVETAGTKTSSYTATVKREYPHLSSNDTSLVPKTVTEHGRTYTLASVDWKAQTAETVDYNEIPESYTGIATYTVSASKTVVTGYVTTAIYGGALSKLNQGATVYTAYFAGTEIMPERIPLELIDSVSEITPEAGPDSAAEPAEPDAGESVSSARTIIPIALIFLLLGAGGGYYMPRIIKNKKSKGVPAE